MDKRFKVAFGGILAAFLFGWPLLLRVVHFWSEVNDVTSFFTWIWASVLALYGDPFVWIGLLLLLIIAVVCRDDLMSAWDERSRWLGGSAFVAAPDIDFRVGHTQQYDRHIFSQEVKITNRTDQKLHLTIQFVMTKRDSIGKYVHLVHIPGRWNGLPGRWETGTETLDVPAKDVGEPTIVFDLLPPHIELLELLSIHCAEDCVFVVRDRLLPFEFAFGIFLGYPPGVEVPPQLVYNLGELPPLPKARKRSKPS